MLKSLTLMLTVQLSLLIVGNAQGIIGLRGGYSLEERAYMQNLLVEFNQCNSHYFSSSYSTGYWVLSETPFYYYEDVRDTLRKALFIRPGVELNIGPTGAFAKDQFLLNLNLGYQTDWAKWLKIKDDRSSTEYVAFWRVSFSPVYASDQVFNNELVYSEIYGMIGFQRRVRQTRRLADRSHATYRSLSFNIGVGILHHLGRRWNELNNLQSGYHNVGSFFEFTATVNRRRKKTNSLEGVPLFIVGLRAKGLWLIDDLNLLNNRSVAGSWEATGDIVLIQKRLFLTFKYEQGNLNPAYKYIRSLTSGITIPL